MKHTLTLMIINKIKSVRPFEQSWKEGLNYINVGAWNLILNNQSRRPKLIITVKGTCYIKITYV